MTGRVLALAVITAVIGLSARSAVAAQSDFFYVNIRQVAYNGELFRITADATVQPPWLFDVRPDVSTGRTGQIRAQAQWSPRLEYDDANESRLGLTKRNAADACQLPSAEAPHLTSQDGSPRLRGQTPCHCIHRSSGHSTLSAPSSCVGDGPSPRRCAAPGHGVRASSIRLRHVGHGRPCAARAHQLCGGDETLSTSPPVQARTLREMAPARRSEQRGHRLNGRPAAIPHRSVELVPPTRPSWRASQVLPRETRPPGRPVAIRQRSAPCAGRR